MFQHFIFKIDIVGGVFIVILLVLLLGAAYTDIKEGRIPNLFIILGLILGVGYRIFWIHEKDYLLLILGILLPVVIFCPLFLIRAMGAGDIKLMAVTGAFFSVSDNVKCMNLAIFLAGVIALIKLFIHRNARERFRYGFSFFKKMCLSAVGHGNFDVPYILKEDEDTAKEAGIHFSVPLLLAAIIVMGGGI